jgi:hypothetical protein
MSTKKKPDDTRSSLLAVGAAIAPHARSLAAGVTLASDDPTRYLQKHAERAKRRGMTKPTPMLPWIALFDELCDAGAGVEIDWRAAPAELSEALRRLRGLPKDALAWMDEDDDLDERKTQALVEAAGAHLAGAVRLAVMDMKSDSYALVLVPADRADELVRGAKAAGFVLQVLAARASKKKAAAKAGASAKGTRDRRIVSLENALKRNDAAMRQERARQAAQEASAAIAEGEPRQAASRCAGEASQLSGLAMRDVMQGDARGWTAIERLVYREVYQGIANIWGISSWHVGMRASYLIYLGEERLLGLYLAAAQDYAGERHWSDKHYLLANFVVALSARTFGTRKDKDRPIGIYQELLDAWEQPPAFARAVHAACERHLTPADPSEFHEGWLTLIPIEILALRAIREKQGLPFPDVDHPLLQTPAANAPQKAAYAPARDELLQGWVALARKENPDLGL